MAQAFIISAHSTIGVSSISTQLNMRVSMAENISDSQSHWNYSLADLDRAREVDCLDVVAILPSPGV